MDTFENNPHESQDPQAGSSAYRGVGTGRKESPYADSPYVMNHQSQQSQASYQQPQQAQQQTSQQPQQDAGSYEQPWQEQPRQNGGAYQRTYYYEPEYPEQQPKQKKVKARKEKKNRTGAWKGILAAVLVLALVAGSCAVTANMVNNSWEKRADEMEADFNQQLSDQMSSLQQQIDAVSEKADQQIVLGDSVEGNMTPAQVYAQNVDAVVMVYSTIIYSSYGQQTTGTSTGSGFIISEDGYIMTNCHVIDGATAVKVVTHNGEEYNARIIGSDATNDVALLKVESEDLPCVTLGSSDALIVGDQVAAIGNPLGELTSTMTVGYVSGKERSVTTDGTTINMIQTDAAINSGNSGGPLFNMKGEVVGITTAKYSGESSSGASIEGIGFAIPIDDALEIVEDLQEYGYVKTAYMGVSVREMDSSVAGMYNLPLGVYVISTEADGPAAAAGILAEDIIIGMGDYEVESYNDLARALRKYEPGDTTTVTVYRSGRELTLTITLAEKPQDTDSGSSQEIQPDADMPSEGSFEEWYDYFAPFFGGGNNGR